MATIDKVPLTTAESLNLLEASRIAPFHLTDYTDGSTTLKLAGGRVENLGSFWYKVNDGDYTIDISAVSGDGTYYVLVLDDGTGEADAYLSTKAGTWDANLGGYYVNDASADDGAKVIMVMSKDGSNYRGKVRTEGTPEKVFTPALVFPVQVIDLVAGDTNFVYEEGIGRVNGITGEQTVYSSSDLQYTGGVRIKYAYTFASSPAHSAVIKIKINGSIIDTLNIASTTSASGTRTKDTTLKIGDDLTITSELITSAGVGATIVDAQNVRLACNALSTVFMSKQHTYFSL
jgi:hypothetical protein